MSQPSGRHNARARHRAPSGRHRAVEPRMEAPASTRGLAVLVSSGMLVAVAATSATAEPLRVPAEARAAGLSVTGPARERLVLSPVVAVPADAAWSAPDFGATATPPPEPEPEPEPEPAPAPASSRSVPRAAAPAPVVRTIPPQAVSGAAVVEFARLFIGTPYVYGGTTPDGFDCSGFTQYVYGHFGISLPRSSDAQGQVGVRIPASEALPGDLLYWPGHVGIYTGNGNHIAARNPGTPLSEGPIYDWSVVFIRLF